MRQLVAIFSTLILFSSNYASAIEEKSNVKINWLTNYEEASMLSQSTSKAMILFFTGSDWCSWCKRLEDEILDTAEFARDTEDKFIFLRLDFPLNTTLSPELSAQNKQLQKNYEVRSFPTLVILDSKQQQIGVTNYSPVGSKQYAAHLFKMVNDYSSYRKKMDSLNEQKLSGLDLKQLYEKAKELSLENDANHLVKIGMESDEKLFFLIERYRFLADEGRLNDKEAIALKEKLFSIDEHNEHQTHYQVAIIDFESFCEQMEKEKYTPEMAVAPLLSYIEKFGKQDKNNLWRLNMIIAQVYFDKNDLVDALMYAQHSYNSAPSSAQPEIAMAIKNIRIQASVQK